MKTRLFILITIALIIASCSSWKTTLVSEGDINDAIRNAITDFMHTCYLRKKDSIFSVSVYKNDWEGYVIRIGSTSENKQYPGPNPIKRVGTYSFMLPSQYQIYDRKLFYWEDTTKIITLEIFDVLKRYNHIDSINLDSLGMLLPYVVDEYAKDAHYYFCRNNLINYKKVVTNWGYGGYTPPKLNCNKYKNKLR